MSLVNTKKMFQKAYKYGYAIGAFNVNNMEIIQGIVKAADELKSPIILQASSGSRKYAGSLYLKKLVEAAVESTDIPIALHLDHGDSFELCKNCIDSGFTSVIPIIVATKLDPTDPLEPTKKPSLFDFLTSLCAIK